MESELEKIAFVYGDVCLRRKRQRRRRRKLLINELLFDYAENSTLHGLRYIVSRGLSIIEKLFWFLTFSVSIVLCSCCIYILYIKWKTNPVIVAINGRPTSVGTIPFPAVTICPQLKVKRDVYDYKDVMDKIRNNPDIFGPWDASNPEYLKYLHIRRMCDDNTLFMDITGGVNFTNVSFINDITEVAPTIADIFQCCIWRVDPVVKNCTLTCNEFFSRVYTEEGVCYTMNTLAANDIFENSIQDDYPFLSSNTPIKGWSESTGYNYSVKYPFPRRGRVLGSLLDMEIVLKNDLNRTCNYMFTGYKVYLHHPADFPQSSLHYHAVIPKQLTSMAIVFHQFQSEPELHKYPVETRQCYFPNERKLRYFKIYTQKNCQAECLSNNTLKHCECVGFFMPHNSSCRICSTDKQDCMVEARDIMAQEEIDAGAGINSNACHCLATCNAIEYSAEVTQAKFNLTEIINDFQNDFRFSRIDLFFKKPQFVTMQRRELFGLLDLLANIGGLMGVFLGFSFLSLVEIFYFLTMRVGCTLKRDSEEENAKETQNRICVINGQVKKTT